MHRNLGLLKHRETNNKFLSVWIEKYGDLTTTRGRKDASDLHVKFQ